MTFNVRDKHFAILGLGKSGLSSALKLRELGAKVSAWDDTPAARETAQSLGIVICEELCKEADEVVISPGINPRTHPIATQASSSGLPLTVDVDILYRLRPDVSYIAITGTNGKSTTTAMLDFALNTLGKKAFLGANFGIPALELADLDAEFFVLEISSYMAEMLEDARFSRVCLINLSPDHLERHGSMEQYIAAKLRLFSKLTPDGKAVFCLDSSYAKEAFKQNKELEAAITFTTDEFPNLYFMNGEHNRQNAACCQAVLSSIGFAAPEIEEALKKFPGLRHRQQIVGKIGHVMFVNDSKATNLDATFQALMTFDDIYLILGGMGKTDDYSPILAYKDRIKAAYLIGNAAPSIARSIDGFIKYQDCGDIKTATVQAYNDAKSAGSAVVLLSPACASFDQFQNFEQRGDKFIEIVQALAQSTVN